MVKMVESTQCRLQRRVECMIDAVAAGVDCRSVRLRFHSRIFPDHGSTDFRNVAVRSGSHHGQQGRPES